MRRAIQATLLTLSLCVLSGCTQVCGQWESVSVTPSEGVAKFNMGQATFNCDGSYEAQMQYNGKDKMSQGTYRYDAVMGTLALTPNEGGARKYGAKVSGNKMTLKHKTDGHGTINVEMKKVGCPPDCKQGCKKGCGKGCEKKEQAKGCGPDCTNACCKKA